MKWVTHCLYKSSCCNCQTRTISYYWEVGIRGSQVRNEPKEKEKGESLAPHLLSIIKESQINTKEQTEKRRLVLLVLTIASVITRLCLELNHSFIEENVPNSMKKDKNSILLDQKSTFSFIFYEWLGKHVNVTFIEFGMLVSRMCL